MRKKRGVLKLWMAIILAFAGLVGVVGVTVLTLFLMGRFEDEVIKPEDMGFVSQLDEGLGFYDPTMSSGNSSYFKVASDFKLTISSSTEGATQNKVTLSLNNGVLVDGFLSNGIIRVPQQVLLNRPFEVTLMKNPTDDLIVGGLSTITASSENVLLSKKTATIAVDTPVGSLGLSVHGNQGLGVQEVIVGTEFTLDTHFLPSNSQNCFSNSLDKKRVFFSPSANLAYNLSTGKFKASEMTGEAEVTAYTFADAYHQKEFLDKFGAEYPNASNALLNNNAITYLINNPAYCAQNTLKLKIVSVKVKDVLFNNINNISPANPLQLVTDTHFNLTANSGNAKLGLVIKDTQGQDRNELFANVGIKVPKGTPLKIVGGRVMKVESVNGQTKISQEDFSGEVDYSSAPEGTEYYILADTTPNDYANYGWRLTSATAVTTQASLNFFFKEDGGWKMFFDAADESVVGINVTQKLSEEPPTWKDNTPINLEINYNQDGQAIPARANLTELLNSVGGNTAVKYFLMMEGQFDSEITNSFACKAAKAYATNYLGSPLSVENIAMPEGGYLLYEIDDEFLLSAFKPMDGSDNSKIYVVAGVIKTDADFKPEMEDGAYKLVSISRAKQIVVESTLSTSNMTYSFGIDASIEPVVEGGRERYYIPAINLTEEGQSKNMLSFTLKLDTKTSKDDAKVEKAFKDGDLRIVDGTNGNQEGDWLVVDKESIQIVANDPSDADSIVTFNGTIKINESKFVASKPYDGKEFRLQLVYNNGKEEFVHPITMKNTGAESFFVYYQRPDSARFTAEYLNSHPAATDGVLDDYISVLNTDDSIIVKWYDKNGNEISSIEGASINDKIANLNKLLAFTLKDRFGRAIDPSVYNIQLEEEEKTATGFTKAGKPIIGLDGSATKITNFSASEKKTVYLAAYVVDKRFDSDIPVTSRDPYVYTDEATKTRMTLPKIKFEITSEGVSKIMQNSTDQLKDAYDVNTEYTQSSSTGFAQVSKVVNKGEEIRDLNDLIKVYTGTNIDPVSSLNFRLDAAVLSNQELMKMVNFTFKDEEKNLVSGMQFNAPFGTATTIHFAVSNENGTFEIDFALTFKVDASISDNFVKYKASINKDAQHDYLLDNPKDSAMAVVFAGTTYNLDSLDGSDGSDGYLKIRSASGRYTYKWEDLGVITADRDGMLVDDSGVCNTITNGVLRIDDLYQCKTISFTLYYGVRSELAPHVKVTLYANPNIVVRQIVKDKNNSPFVDVEKLSDKPETSLELASAFELHRATAYIANEHNFAASTKFEKAMSYKNLASSGEQFINIQGGKFVINSSNNLKLSLVLGTTFLQEFLMYYTEGSEEIAVDAIKIKSVEGEGDFIQQKCEPVAHTKISVSLGFGEDEIETVKAIFGDGISLVKYEGKVHLLLSANQTYQPLTGLVDTDSNSMTGDLSIGTGGKLQAKNIEGVFSVAQNTFSIKKQIANLAVSIRMSAIVSRVGGQFVYYGDGTLVDGKLVYNTFGDVDFKTLISSNAADLEANNIFQTLSAGKTYQMVHDTKQAGDAEDEELDLNNIYGFYYNSELRTTSAKLSKDKVYGILDGRKVDIEGLVSVDEKTNQITINHLAENVYEEVYVVLRFALSNGAGNKVWLYRIKVLPSFKAGSVLYPYDVEARAEYLNVNTDAFKGEEKGYEIDLDENFHLGNSRFSSGTRFVAPTADAAAFDAAEISHFAVTKVNGKPVDGNSSLFTHSFTKAEDGHIIFNIKPVDKTAALAVTISRTYYVDKKVAVGSQLEYTFAFNQGQQYIHELRYDADGKLVGTLASNPDVYVHTLTAGEAERQYSVDVKIKVDGNDDWTNTVKDLTAYVFADQPEEALMKKAIAAKDIEVAEGVTIKKGEVFGDWTSEDFAVGQQISINIDGTEYTYILKAGDIEEYTYAYLTQKEGQNKRTLHIKAKETVKKDYNFVVGFFTTQKVVFKINFSVTSFYVKQLNQTAPFEFEGANVYKFLNPNDNTTVSRDNNYLFEVLKDGRGENASPIDNVVIELANADEEIQNSQSFGGQTLRLGQLVKINNATLENGSFDWKNATVEFTHLLKRVTFKFKATVLVYEKDESGNFAEEDEAREASFKVQNSYTFDFEIEIKKPSFTRESVSYGGVVFYGADKIETSMNAIESANNFLATKKNVTSKFMFKKGDVISQTMNEVAQLSGKQIGEKFTISDNSIVCMFGDVEIFNIPLTYQYTALPNVKLQNHYPMPDQKTSANCEYVATTQKVENGSFTFVAQNFFNTSALFAQVEDWNTGAQKKRIEVANVERSGDVKFVNVKKNWKIYLDTTNTTDNVSLTFDSKTYDKTSANESASSDVLLTSADMTEDNFDAPNFDALFTLVSGESGKLVFKLIVNEVEISYEVNLVKDSVVDIVTNPLNYTLDVETIYAEDLASQEKNIFATNRILKYVLRTGGTYYIKITDGTNNKIEKITGAAGQVCRIDLGKSYEGCRIEGTYNVAILDDDGNIIGVDEETRCNNSDVYTDDGVAILTARVVAQYKNGTPILLKETENESVGTFLQYFERTSQNASVLSGETVGKLSAFTLGSRTDITRSLTIKLCVNGQTINTSGTYGVKLALDFSLGKSADTVADILTAESLPTPYNLNAIPTNSFSQAPWLLSLDNGFDIRRVRGQQEALTSDLLETTGGRLTLQEYGFYNLQVVLDENLSAESYGYEAGSWDYQLALTAGKVHNFLTSNAVPNANNVDVVYKTGLTPRAGKAAEQINQIGSTEANELNYVTLTGNKGTSDRATDWRLQAQGASNDGNFVMMKLTYSVDLGNGERASTAHNLLFRILPNSEIRFKNVFNTEERGVDEVVENRTISTNKASMFMLTDEIMQQELESLGSNKVITLYNTASSEDSKIVAYMRGQSDNLANTFTFTYTTSLTEGSRTYNNWNSNSSVNNWIENSNGYWTTNDKEPVANKVYVGVGKDNGSGSGRSLLIGVASLPLGERHFVVEFEDAFGFKGRFYFQIVSSNNPKVASVSNSGVMSEGQDFVFGANYNLVTPESASVSDDSRYMVYQPFQYDAPTAEGSNWYYNTIELTKKSNDAKFKIAGAMLMLKVGSEIEENESGHAGAYYIGGKQNNEAINLSEGQTITKTISADDIPSSADDISLLKILSDSDCQSDTGNVGDANLNGWKLSGTENAVVFGNKENFNNDILNVPPNKQQKDFQREKFKGSTITLRLLVKPASDDGKAKNFNPVGTFGVSVEAGSSDVVTKTLACVYTANADETPATIEGDGVKVNLNGIKAYAFDNNLGAVDINSITGTATEQDSKKLSNFTSSVNKISIKKVEFFHDGKQIGTSYVEGLASETTIGASLMTSKEVSFVEKAGNSWEVITGKSSPDSTAYSYKVVETGELSLGATYYYQADNGEYVSFEYMGYEDATWTGKTIYSYSKTEGAFASRFVVPYIDGILFGTGRQLENVVMKITLQDDSLSEDDDKTAEIETTVTIQREFNEKIFSSKDVLDGDAPEANSSDDKQVLNDTLEISLKPKENVEFVVSDRQIDSIVTNSNGKKTMYVKTADTERDYSKTYYIKTGTVYTKVTATDAELSEGWFERYDLLDSQIVKATGAADYATTKFEGISKNIVGLQKNLKKESFFFVYITKHTIGGEATEQLPTILYNGSALTSSDTTRLEVLDEEEKLVTYAYNLNGTKIASYENNMKLHIADIDELNGLTKTQILYFLIQYNPKDKDTNNDIANNPESNAKSQFVYQHQEVFTIHPQYVRAVNPQEIVVENYIKVGNSGTGKQYYMISLENWASIAGKEIELLRWNDNQSIADRGTLTTSNAYQFKFVINKEDGVAFIDENGLITTAEDFKITDNVITVNVFMKVSGNDGHYESDKTNILLSTFVIRLMPNGDMEDGWQPGAGSSMVYNPLAIGQSLSLVGNMEYDSKVRVALNLGEAVKLEYYYSDKKVSKISRVLTKLQGENAGTYASTFRLEFADGTTEDVDDSILEMSINLNGVKTSFGTVLKDINLPDRNEITLDVPFNQTADCNATYIFRKGNSEVEFDKVASNYLHLKNAFEFRLKKGDAVVHTFEMQDFNSTLTIPVETRTTTEGGNQIGYHYLQLSSNVVVGEKLTLSSLNAVSIWELLQNSLASESVNSSNTHFYFEYNGVRTEVSALQLREDGEGGYELMLKKSDNSFISLKNLSYTFVEYETENNNGRALLTFESAYNPTLNIKSYFGEELSKAELDAMLKTLLGFEEGTLCNFSLKNGTNTILFENMQFVYENGALRVNFLKQVEAPETPDATDENDQTDENGEGTDGEENKVAFEVVATLQNATRATIKVEVGDSVIDVALVFDMSKGIEISKEQFVLETEEKPAEETLENNFNFVTITKMKGLSSMVAKALNTTTENIGSYSISAGGATAKVELIGHDGIGFVFVLENGKMLRCSEAVQLLVTSTHNVNLGTVKLVLAGTQFENLSINAALGESSSLSQELYGKFDENTRYYYINDEGKEIELNLIKFTQKTNYTYSVIFFQMVEDKEEVQVTLEQGDSIHFVARLLDGTEKFVRLNFAVQFVKVESTLQFDKVYQLIGSLNENNQIAGTDGLLDEALVTALGADFQIAGCFVDAACSQDKQISAVKLTADKKLQLLYQGAVVAQLSSLQTQVYVKQADGRSVIKVATDFNAQKFAAEISFAAGNTVEASSMDVVSTLGSDVTFEYLGNTFTTFEFKYVGTETVAILLKNAGVALSDGILIVKPEEGIAVSAVSSNGNKFDVTVTIADTQNLQKLEIECYPFVTTYDNLVLSTLDGEVLASAAVAAGRTFADRAVEYFDSSLRPIASINRTNDNVKIVYAQIDKQLFVVKLAFNEVVKAQYGIAMECMIGERLEFASIDAEILSAAGITGNSFEFFFNENNVLKSAEAYVRGAGVDDIDVVVKAGGTFHQLNILFTPQSSEMENGSSGLKSNIIYFNANYGIVVVPKGYYIYQGTQGGALEDSESVEFAATHQDTLACTVGTTLDLHQLFDGAEIGEVDFSKLHNKKYHVVMLTNNSDKKTEFAYFNNVDSWTFNTAGTFSVSVVLTYRDDNKTVIKYKAFNFNVMVYNSSASSIRDVYKEFKYEENQTASIVEEGKEETWWLLSEGKAIKTNGQIKTVDKASTEVTTTDTPVILKGTNLHKLSFLVESKEDGVISYYIANASIFVYGQTNFASVSLGQNNKYKLKNVLGDEGTALEDSGLNFVLKDENGSVVKTYSFFDSNGRALSEVHFPNMGVGSNFDAEYMLIVKNAAAETEKVLKFVVKFKVVGSSTASERTENSYVAVSQKLSENQNENIQYFAKEDLNNAILSVLGLKETNLLGYADGKVKPNWKETYPEKPQTFVLIQERADNNLLSVSNDVQFNGKDVRIQKKYVVTYRTADRELVTTTLMLNIYVYSKAQKPENVEGVLADGSVYSYNSDADVFNFTYTADKEYTAFDISKIAADVRSVINAGIENEKDKLTTTTVITFNHFVNGILQVVKNVALQGNVAPKTYYVNAGETYYLFSIAFKVKPAIEKQVVLNVGQQLQLDTLDDWAKTSISGTREGKVTYYVSDKETLVVAQSITREAGVSSKTVFVKFEGDANAYEFEVVFVGRVAAHDAGETIDLKVLDGAVKEALKTSQEQSAISYYNQTAKGLEKVTAVAKPDGQTSKTIYVKFAGDETLYIISIALVEDAA